MLNSFSLKQKLLLLVSIPLLIAVILSSVLISTSHDTKQNAQAIETLMQLAVANSELVHELQKERGLTAGFFGSNFSSQFKQKLSSQRQNADQKKAAKFAINNAVNDQIEKLGLTALLQKNRQTIAEIENVRRRVDNNQITLPEALGFYTGLNGQLLSVISTISELATSAEIKQTGLAYFYFVQGKERAGIERAVLSNTFAKNSMDLAWFKRFNSLVLLQNTYLAEFENLASTGALNYYNNAVNDDAFNQVANYRSIVESKNLTGNFNQDAASWFDAATKRINVLKDVENYLANSLLNLAAERKANAQSALYFYLLLTVVMISICTAIAVFIIRKINKQVKVLVDTLNYCAENNALNKQIEITSRDEFSRISTGINSLLATFTGAIENITESSESLAASSTQNSVAVSQTSSALHHQKMQTEHVAVAIEEMSNTIGEVARSTCDTSEAAKKAEQLADDSAEVVINSIEQIGKVSENVNEVHGIVSTLNESSAEITNVVDVIKSVAEQTNLLALNAAIEAARAGEQGRGFAVVADEVRTLAQRTQESTKQIEDIISQFADATNKAFTVIVNCQKNAQNSVDSSGKITQSINTIQESILMISDMAMQIASASEEQVAVSKEISENISQINAAADESAVAAEEISATSQSQSDLANSLKKLSASFQV